MDASLQFIRRACNASLHRLQTDYIDVYQFHVSTYDPVGASVVRDILEEPVVAGKIRADRWSTDDPERVRIFAQSAHYTAISNDDTSGRVTIKRCRCMKATQLITWLTTTLASRDTGYRPRLRKETPYASTISDP